MSTDETPEVLAARVRFDLESAGFRVLVADQSDGEEGGVAVFVGDDHQVNVDWSTHRRLDQASLDMSFAQRPHEDVVSRYESVCTTMHAALGSVLNTFGYHAEPPLFGFGYVVTPQGTNT
ncbi:hypothetical protein [Streptomyces demainii]|uniref:Uncharacterized protein n=1 Tax=Streptomyces demainii TaxID=588122 RepID=A0ABT9L710_9ACTN|nr:hypothetical protein [Streptomyces demainii]MDP9616482.1 hypothetical protein [Streptomyces demainii]